MKTYSIRVTAQTGCAYLADLHSSAVSRAAGRGARNRRSASLRVRGALQLLSLQVITVNRRHCSAREAAPGRLRTASRGAARLPDWSVPAFLDTGLGCQL